MRIIYITGGQRSGKSSFAQKLAKEKTGTPYYLATSRVLDDDFQQRVNKHIADRDESWTTIEEEKNISSVEFPANSIVVIDCITLWLVNLFLDNSEDIDKTLLEAKAEWEVLIKKDITIIVISNEIGMGLHADTPSGRKFTDLQGWMNQYIAQTADEAYFMVSGLSIKLKQNKQLLNGKINF